MSRVTDIKSKSVARIRPVWLESRRGLLSLLVAILCALATMAAWTQEAPRLISNGHIAAGSTINVNVGHSDGLVSSWNIARVSVADPSVADVTPLDATTVMIVGKSIGQTDLILWGGNGEIWTADIQVNVDIETLNTDLAGLFPRTGVKVIQSRDVFFVQGTMEHAEQTRQLNDYLVATGLQYVDMTSLAGLQQVQLKVRIAEVNRVAIKKMGVNILKAGASFFGASTIGSASGGALFPVGIDPVGAANTNNVPFMFSGSPSNPFSTLLLGFPKADLEFFIQALAENQYLKVLAEPTLVALSGEEASFLAGGEFPIPVVQASGSDSLSITIQYKEFGVRLNFTPTVLGDGRIRLHLSPEVSEISDIGAVEIEGFRVPSVKTRRVDTTLEMRSGQTFSVAGLLNESATSRNTRVPVLGDLPILGSLFRSVSYQRGETELVVLVTPTLVEPSSSMAKRPLPGDLHITPNEWDLFMSGRIEGKLPETDEAAGEESADLSQLDELKGPGAWANYQEKETNETYAGTSDVPIKVSSN